MVARLRLRRAVLADSRKIWLWRNDPDTRRNSLTIQRVPWTRHVQWYRQALRDPRCCIYVAMRGKDKVGVLRHDLRSAKVVEVSINVNPMFRGQGLGKRILALSTALLGKKQPRCTQKAIIRSANVASARTFLAGGFVRGKKMYRPARHVWVRRTVGLRAA